MNQDEYRKNEAKREKAVERVIAGFMALGMDREEATRAFRHSHILDLIGDDPDKAASNFGDQESQR